VEFTDIKAYIGQTIDVKIDRPLGSRHPERGFIYSVNYGYVPNVPSPDGEELDVYILGVFKPLENFTGQCIAVIHRIDDNDDKLVVVPAERTYTDDQIIALTEFQERFHKSVIMR
jgi:inorganic pyrophosphatase